MKYAIGIAAAVVAVLSVAQAQTVPNANTIAKSGRNVIRYEKDGVTPVYGPPVSTLGDLLPPFGTKVDTVNGTLTNPTITGGTMVPGSMMLPANPSLQTCPVGNCPIAGTPGFGGAYNGPTLSAQWIYGQSTSAKNPQFQSNIGLYVKDDGSLQGQYVTQYLGAMQGPNAGPTWSLNSDIVRGACAGGTYSINNQPGSGIPFGEGSCATRPGALGSVSTIGYELDLSNFDADTATSGAFVTGLYINAYSKFTSSNGIMLSNARGVNESGGTSPSWHNGLVFGERAVADRTVFDYSGSTNGWVSGGVHANASFVDTSTGLNSILLQGTKTAADINSTSGSPAMIGNSGVHSAGTMVDTSNSPLVFGISGTHSLQVFSDSSTSPAAFNLTGSYALAAITTQGATTPTALLAKAGQSVCWAPASGSPFCAVVNGSGRFVLSNGATNLFSVDGSGNVIAKGTIQANGLP